MGWTEHGDIMALNPSGASQTTANQDNLAGGVGASRTMVTTDINNLGKYKSIFYQVARETGVHPALIGAIASRESRAGGLLEATNGYGDHGKAYGLMQADLANSGIPQSTILSVHWASTEHVMMVIKKNFLGKVALVRQNKPWWSGDLQLQGAVAAYNMGENNVGPPEDIDRNTTGRDYSNDVIARAQHLVRSFGWN